MELDWTLAGLSTLGAVAGGVVIAWALAIRRSRAGLILTIVALLILGFPPLSTWLRKFYFAIVAMPFVILTVEPRLARLDRDFANAARSLGASEWRIFHRLLLPLAWRAIAASALFAFVRVIAGGVL